MTKIEILNINKLKECKVFSWSFAHLKQIRSSLFLPPSPPKGGFVSLYSYNSPLLLKEGWPKAGVVDYLFTLINNRKTRFLNFLS
jgi:hypothetical protein